MTKPRLPTIGDSVRRVVDGKVEFDGLVASTRGSAVFVARPHVPLEVVRNGEWPAICAIGTRDDAMELPAVYLVRRLHGWRWAPFDGRPQLGDTVTHLRNGYPDDTCRMTLWHACRDGEAGVRVGEWHARREADGSDETLSERDMAKAIAGIDGWSWEPARWSGK